LSFRFKVAPRAARQIRTAAKWWLENRPRNPTGLTSDLEAAFLLIEDLPNAGEAVTHRSIPNLRRVLLGLTQYYLYYSVDTDQQVGEILVRSGTRVEEQIPRCNGSLTPRSSSRGPALARQPSCLEQRELECAMASARGTGRAAEREIR
jgi:hypothetical protein